MLLKLLLVCDVSWNASIEIFLYQNRIFDILLSSHHMWNIVWSLGPWKASTTASQGEVPRRWGQVSEQLFLLDIFRCKEDIPSKGNGCPVAMYFIFQGPIWICVFLLPTKNQEGKDFCGEIWLYHFFHLFFLQKPSRYHSPWNNWELGWRHQDALIHLERIVLRLQGWCDGVNFLRPFRSCTANCCIFLGRNYGPFSSA